MGSGAMDPLAFPGFRLIVEIGGGALGVVWRSRELESQGLVAIKIYRPEILRRTAFVSGLDAAVLAARAWRHPAAAAVLGLVEAKSGGGIGLVTELAGGEVLARALQRNVRFSPGRALKLARLAAEALSAAHARRLCAGTLHPGHLVLSGDSLKLLGVGVGNVEGLPARYDHAPEEGRFAPAVYAAPEVLSGAAADPRADVFSLGAVLYHMLTGLPPFRARELPGLKLERSEGLRWPRGADSVIPPEAVGLVGRALELDPALRPTAGEFAAFAGKILSGEAEAERSDGKGSTRVLLESPLGSVPEMPPPEPRAYPAAGGSAGRSRSMREMLTGALAATLLLAAGAVLGRHLWFPAREEPAAPARPAAAAPQPPGAPKPAGPDEAARREFEAVMAVLAEKPANLAPIRERLSALAAHSRGTEWGLRAELKLAELVEAERRERSEEYRKLSERVRERESADRFGEALALLEKPPGSLAGTEWEAQALAAMAGLRRRAAARYEEIRRRAERSVADGDLVAAMLDYESVTKTFGLEDLVAPAARRLAELSRQQEEAGQRAARSREEERRARAAEGLRKGLESARILAATFRYGPAEAVLDALAADAEQPEDGKKLAKQYAELIRAEEKIFRLAGKRVADGIRELNVSKEGLPQLTVTRLDEKGLTADCTEMKGVLFTWESIARSSQKQVYGAIKLTIDVTSAEEHLALATVAFHHGQSLEIENNLKLAADLDAGTKAAAEAQAGLYRQIEARLAGRRDDEKNEKKEAK